MDHGESAKADGEAAQKRLSVVGVTVKTESRSGVLCTATVGLASSLDERVVERGIAMLST